MEKTLKNLSAAFIGESQARNRYTFYSKIAKKEGYEQISAIFRDTADQEKEHASQLIKMINKIKGDNTSIQVEAPVANILGNTQENLEAAIAGEHYEYSEMYPDFAKIAEEEGLGRMSDRLRAIAKAEEHHEERYKKLLSQLKENTIFKKQEEIIWVCRECGYQHKGTEAPEKCPSCDHPRAYYQVKCENY